MKSFVCSFPGQNSEEVSFSSIVEKEVDKEVKLVVYNSKTDTVRGGRSFPPSRGLCRILSVCFTLSRGGAGTSQKLGWPGNDRCNCSFCLLQGRTRERLACTGGWLDMLSQPDSCNEKNSFFFFFFFLI
jgi:hypothetical protein